MSDANVIYPGLTVKGYLEEGIDYYKITIPSSGRLDINIISKIGYYSIFIANEQGGGVYYEYKHNYSLNYIGTVSKTFLIKPKTVTGLKATSYSYNSIKLYWTKQSGVTKYAVYRSTSKTRGYKRIAYVYSNGFINTSLSTGTSYYYKVRAIKTVNKTNYYGKYSSISYAKPVPRKTKVSLTAGRKKMTIKWSKIKGASGYEIYRATSKKGKFIKIRTASYKYFSYTNTHLAVKKTYFYKVRSYRTVKGKRIYSSYSNIVYKKTK